ncbi:MAG: ATP-dependent DNA helicase RecG [Desulfuromonadaceae bacterium]
MSQAPSRPQPAHPLATSLAAVRGVGSRLLEKLSKLGLHTVEDALYALPHRYEDRRQLKKIAQLSPGSQEIFTGEIIFAGESASSSTKNKRFEVIVTDGSGQVVLKWFRYRSSWMKNQFTVGRKGIFIGELKRFGAIREIHHPDVDFLSPGQAAADKLLQNPLSFGRILPVYSLTAGLSQKTLRKIMKEVVEGYAAFAATAIPEEIIRRRQLCSLSEALRLAHWPDSNSSLKLLAEGKDAARQTLVFDELFFLQLGLALKRRGVVLEKGIPFKVEHRYTKPLVKMLPYALTDAQRRVLGEIKRDLMAPHPMNRLLQGDVGSGKTIVALMAALIAIENQTQVAVVAPTEILAEQHYLQFHRWLDALGLQTVLLTGALTGKEKQHIYESIGDGSIHLVVGTHALLQESVEFRRLGLGIIDEQHRFGVRQRGALKHKGSSPHILVMTATPIPRTLSLTLYGDLTLSVIDRLPPGRSPIETRVVTDSSRARAYSLIKKELKKGRQAYIVYPLVKESEKSDLLAASEGSRYLQEKVFPEHVVGLLHGQLKSEEKEAIMMAFKNREIHVLVSTTVIEVGIDVSNATVMMIEHAERFGLAQLHQLRGRVGRGSDPGTCLLVRSLRCSKDGSKRLQVMTETCDGFRIAEADLSIRGPGEFLGTKQSGLPDFRVANLLQDGKILEEARQEAFELAAQPDFMTEPRYEQVRQILLARWGSRLELAGIG